MVVGFVYLALGKSEARKQGSPSTVIKWPLSNSRKLPYPITQYLFLSPTPTPAPYSDSRQVSDEVAINRTDQLQLVLVLREGP